MDDWLFTFSFGWRLCALVCFPRNEGLLSLPFLGLACFFIIPKIILRSMFCPLSGLLLMLFFFFLGGGGGGGLCSRFTQQMILQHRVDLFQGGVCSLYGTRKFLFTASFLEALASTAYMFGFDVKRVSSVTSRTLEFQPVEQAGCVILV